MKNFTRARKALGIVFRRRPWLVHFQGETMTAGDSAALLRFIISGNALRQGAEIAKYERRFAYSIEPGGKGRAFSFGAGRMALYAICEALGIGEGDEVILPAFTCKVVVAALSRRGAKPVYCDIDPKTLNMDSGLLRGLITAKTKAVIAQHTFGVPCDMDRINETARESGIYVIEDCALSQGAKYKGRQVGTLGHASFFSTDRTKTISTLTGGIAFTLDGAIAERLEEIYARTPHLPFFKAANAAVQASLLCLLYNPFVFFAAQPFILLAYYTGIFFWPGDEPGDCGPPRSCPYPYRLMNFQAFLGLRELNRMDGNLALRRSAVEAYSRVAREKGIHLPYGEEDVGRLTLRFSLYLKDRDAFRRKWMHYLDLGSWFDSPAQGVYGAEGMKTISYEQGSCPRAEWAHAHIANFPTHVRYAVLRKWLLGVFSTLKPGDTLSPDECPPAGTQTGAGTR